MNLSLLAISNWEELLQEQGGLESAANNYERAIALNPDNAAFHYHLGTAQALQQALNKALASYERALALNPEYSKAREALKSIKSQLSA